MVVLRPPSRINSADLVNYHGEDYIGAVYRAVLPIYVDAFTRLGGARKGCLGLLGLRWREVVDHRGSGLPS